MKKKVCKRLRQEAMEMMDGNKLTARQVYKISKKLYKEGVRNGRVNSERLLDA